jgi:hypothetical protein
VSVSIADAAMAVSVQQLQALAALIIAAPEREPQPLAQALGVSLVSINRGLEQHLGLSLRDLLLSYRMRSWRIALQFQADVLDSALDYFGALSTAYRHAGKALGMTPARLKKGGTGERIQYGRVHSNWGILILAITEAGVCWMCSDGFEHSAEELFSTYPEATLQRNDPFFASWLAHTTQRLSDRYIKDLPRDIMLAVLQHHLLDAKPNWHDLAASSHANESVQIKPAS